MENLPPVAMLFESVLVEISVLHPRAPRRHQQLLCVIFVSQLLQYNNISSPPIIVNACKNFLLVIFYLQAFRRDCGGWLKKSDRWPGISHQFMSLS
jgi:hypothetical protein